VGTTLVEQNVAAQMRDGVTLYADVFRPAEPGRFPVLLARTSYSKGPDAMPDTLAAARAV
jgi:uncharacterized protein